jgi:hypothetical protein
MLSLHRLVRIQVPGLFKYPEWLNQQTASYLVNGFRSADVVNGSSDLTSSRTQVPGPSGCPSNAEPCMSRKDTPQYIPNAALSSSKQG